MSGARSARPCCKSRCDGLIAEHQEKGEAVESGTVQVTEGRALEIGRHRGVALGWVLGGRLHRVPSADRSGGLW